MSWLGALNLIVLQWFGIRLARVFTMDLVGDGSGKCYRQRSAYRVLRWVWPLTGWWQPYRWIHRVWPQPVPHHGLRIVKTEPIENAS